VIGNQSLGQPPFETSGRFRTSYPDTNNAHRTTYLRYMHSKQISGGLQGFLHLQNVCNDPEGVPDWPNSPRVELIGSAMHALTPAGGGNGSNKAVKHAALLRAVG
jgi:hypothetical protein